MQHLLYLLMMKRFFFVCNFLVIFSIFSQKKYSSAFKLQSDNDLYVSLYNDRYYTNGLFLSYQYLSTSKNENVEKKIVEWQIGHQMYTPFIARALVESLHDRPFAAYLFGSYSITTIYKNNQNLKTTLQLGIIGKNAFGREIQNFIHDIYGFKRPVGWDLQIKSALGLNLNVSYIKLLNIEKSNTIDFSFVANGRVGTIFTDFSVGFLSRTGFVKLTGLNNSMAFDTNLNGKNTPYHNKKEAFIFFKPFLNYVFYDATLEGSFLNNSSEITKNPINLRFGLELGTMFTVKKFNFSYIINFQTKETKNLRTDFGNTYGKIIIRYLL